MTHLYLMPGMAANSSIFEHISLPKSTYTVHYLEWFLPEQNETIQAYALRMCSHIRLVEDIDVLVKYAFGASIKNRVALYKKYLSMNDRRYMRWAVREMVCWDQIEPLKNTIHIHGTGDKVFPYKYINDAIFVDKGTHIMIITRAKWFNKFLPQLIENEYIKQNEFENELD